MGVQVECVISDYLSKDKLTEFPIIIFHPSGSRFTNQTITIKRGSTIFFSGALTLIENKLYLELHNFNFICTYQNLPLTSTKHMLWSKNLTSNNNFTTTIVQAIHNSKKSITLDDLSVTITQVTLNDHILTLTKSPIQIIRKNSPTPVSTNKRKTRSSHRISNKVQKLADIASNAISIVDSDFEGIED